MNKEHTAKVIGRDLPVSLKHCIEIGNLIRGKPTTKAKVILEGVIAKKIAVPMKNFNFDTGHKKGIGPGRYPENASKQVLSLIKSAEMNAQNKGLDLDSLFVKVYIANKGTSQWRFGRQRRRQAKRTNLEIVLQERESKEKKQPKKEVPKEQPMKEASKEQPKKEVPKEQPKKEVPKEQPKKEVPKEQPKKEVPKEQPKKEASKEQPKKEASKEQPKKEASQVKNVTGENPKEDNTKQ